MKWDGSVKERKNLFLFTMSSHNLFKKVLKLPTEALWFECLNGSLTVIKSLFLCPSLRADSGQCVQVRAEGGAF